MSFALERAVAVGDTWVAALVGQAIERHATPHRLTVTADKRPVALLIGCDGRMTAFTPAGGPLEASEVERWCPGATAQFMRSRPARVNAPSTQDQCRSGT